MTLARVSFLVCLLACTPASAQRACHISPDGRFAVSWAPTGGRVWQVITLPEERVVLDYIGVHADYDFNPWPPKPELMWSADSKRFAVYSSPNMLLGRTHVFERRGNTFVEVKVIDPQAVGQDEAIEEYGRKLGFGKLKYGSRLENRVEPVRWKNANTLVLREFGSATYSDDGERYETFNWSADMLLAFQEKGWVKVNWSGHSDVWLDEERAETHKEILPKSGVVSVSPDALALPGKILVRSHPGGENWISPNGKYGFVAPDRGKAGCETEVLYLTQLEPLRVLGPVEKKVFVPEEKESPRMMIRWASDSSAAILVEYSANGVHHASLTELHDGRLARVTDLLPLVTNLLMPDYRRCKPGPPKEFSKGEEPFAIDFLAHPPEFDGNGNVVMHCEGWAPRWVARLNAVWNMKESRFVEHKVVRGVCKK